MGRGPDAKGLAAEKQEQWDQAIQFYNSILVRQPQHDSVSCLVEKRPSPGKFSNDLYKQGLDLMAVKNFENAIIQFVKILNGRVIKIRLGLFMIL
ncbi:MAG: hypothetical protein U0V48_00165 [Anaerolineales bacterium]